MVSVLVQDVLEIFKLAFVYRFIVGARIKQEVKRKVICAACAIAFLLCHSLAFPGITISVVYICFLFLIVFLCEGLILNKVLSVMMAWIAWQIFDTLILLIYSLFKNMNPFRIFMLNNIESRIAINGVTVPMLFLIWLRCRKLVIKNWLTVKGQLWQYVCLFFSSISVLTLTGLLLLDSFYNIRPEMLPRFYLILGISILGLLMPVMALFFYGKQMKQTTIRQQENLLAYQRQNELQLKYYEDMREKSEELKAFRHDFHHHMQTLFVLMRENKYEEAVVYLERLQDLGGEENIQIRTYTGNQMIDASIFGVLSLHENRGIEFECKGHLPEKLGIEAVDLCRLMSNAMENAAHACIEADKPEIKLNVKMYENMLYMELMNTCGAMSQLPFMKNRTMARGGDGHGYGIYNINEVVSKYHGYMEYVAEGSSVLLKIELLQIVA